MIGHCDTDVTLTAYYCMNYLRQDEILGADVVGDVRHGVLAPEECQIHVMGLFELMFFM